MTLVPHPEMADEVRKLSHTCLVCGELGGQDFLLNIILFVPLGIGLGLTGISRLVALSTVVLTTAAVESLQYTVIIGRHASLSDLVSNSIGGWLGITLASRWRAFVLPGRRAARWQAGLAMVGWLAIEMGSGLLLSVSVPPATYFSAWAPEFPELPGFEQFRGSVLGASVDEIAIPPARLTNSSALRERLEAGQFTLQVRATPGAPSSILAPLVRVRYGGQTEVLLLAQLGTDFVYRVRTHSADLRLLNPTLHLVVSQPLADMFQVRAGRDLGRMFIEVSSNEREYRRDLAISPSWGWSFLIPFDYSFGPEVHFLTGLWIAGLLLPVAYWAQRAADGRRGKWQAAGALVALVILGLGACPQIAGLPPVHWSEWLAAAAGAAVGWWLAAVSHAIG